MKVFMTGARGGIGSVIRGFFIDRGVSVTAPTSLELDLSTDFVLNDTEQYDGLIYCAGVNYLNPYNEIDYNQFIKLLNINALSFLRLCSILHLKDGANIVAIGSLYAEDTKELRVQYASSKHAMLGMVQTLALELSKRKIKVNMISPGFVDTPMTRQNNTTERIAYLNDTIPLGLVNSVDLAELCYWFLTTNNAITGQNIKVDGGYSLRGT